MISLCDAQLWSPTSGQAFTIIAPSPGITRRFPPTIGEIGALPFRSGWHALYSATGDAFRHFFAGAKLFVMLMSRSHSPIISGLLSGTTLLINIKAIFVFSRRFMRCRRQPTLARLFGNAGCADCARLGLKGAYVVAAAAGCAVDWF